MPGLLLALLLAITPALGRCFGDSCSNDRDGVLGDEELAWSASEGADYYGIAVHGETCAWVINATSYALPATPCDGINDGSGFRVRACWRGERCSTWSAPVEVLPYACLVARDWDPCLYRDTDGQCVGGHRTQCERPCYPGAPLRLQGKYPPC